MKKLNDEEIQRLLEGEIKPSDELLSVDEKESLDQYRFLFEKLKEEPKEGLPYGFASNVKRQVQRQLNRKRDVRFYLIAFVALILCFGAFYQALLVVNEDAGAEFIAAFYKFKWVMFLGSAIFIGILYLDQRLVKEGS